MPGRNVRSPAVRAERETPTGAATAPFLGRHVGSLAPGCDVGAELSRCDDSARSSRLAEAVPLLDEGDGEGDAGLHIGGVAGLDAGMHVARRDGDARGEAALRRQLERLTYS